MFLALTNLAGQNVFLRRLFGTQNTPSHTVIINDLRDTEGLLREIWALGLWSGCAFQRGEQVLDK